MIDSESKVLKLFFRGKPLKDEETIEEHSIFYN